MDFNSELQPGDGFALAFERYTREDGPATYGDITAAEFRNDGRVLRAIRFTPPGGKPGYYDEAGRSLRRFFLRSPLKFEPRITSRFSSSRRHPVLHTARAHRGVDYAAPVGAPVIAAAGGTVVSVTRDGANGRMVRLRHASGYESRYLHLSAFARGPPRRRSRGSGGHHRLRGIVGPGHRSAPALRADQERRVREPAGRAAQPAAGGAAAAPTLPLFAAARDEALARLARVAGNRNSAIHECRIHSTEGSKLAAERVQFRALFLNSEF